MGPSKMAFDPDKYLAAKKGAGGFDPDAYLASKNTGYTPPLSPEQQSASITKARQDAVKSLPIGERFAAGVGKGLMDTYAGLGQLATKATDAVGITDGANKKLTQAYQGERDLYESATQGDVASRVGEVGGNLALSALVPVGGAAGLAAKGGKALGGKIGGMLASRVGSMAAGGAAEGAAFGAAQFADEDESRLANTAVGGAIGGAIPAAVGAIKPIRQAISKGRNIISRLSEIDEAALQKAANDPGALSDAVRMQRRTGGDMSGVADDLMGRVQGVANEEDLAIQAVNADRKTRLQQELLQARPGEPIASLADVSPYGAGKRIEAAAQTANRAAGEQFGASQAAILDAPTARVTKKKPTAPTIGGKGLQFGGPEGDQNAFELAVDSFLDEAGVGRGGKQYGVIGNVSIPPGAINEIRNMKSVFSTALNTRDMLDQLRLVDNRINFGGADGARLFARGSQEDLAIKSMRARLDDALEAQIGRAAGKSKGDVLAAWAAHREAFSNTRRVLESVQDGLGAGTVNQEAYINRIKNIGVDDLRRIAEQARTDANIAPVWAELRKGFYDAVIAKGIKDDGIDFDLMKKAWDGIDDELKLTMLPYQVASHIDDVLSRTKLVDFAGQTLKETNRVAGFDRQRLIGSLENAGTKAKRTDLQDLEKLDDLLGLEGKDRFSEQAKSFALGKQLGVTPKGELPLFSGSRTGARNTGALIGAALGAGGGYSQGDGMGAGIGVPAGALAGMALQSPAGALAVYKILMKMQRAGAGAERASRPLVRSAGQQQLSRGLRSLQFSGENE